MHLFEQFFLDKLLDFYNSSDLNIGCFIVVGKVDKLVKLYNSISDDKDYHVLVKVIKDAVKEAMHRSKLIGFSNQEIEKLENLNKEINI